LCFLRTKQKIDTKRKTKTRLQRLDKDEGREVTKERETKEKRKKKSIFIVLTDLFFDARYALWVLSL
jgi:hypothetical protein